MDSGFQLLMLGFIFGCAIGYMVQRMSAPLSEEEYQKRRAACQISHDDKVEKIKELDEMDKKLNRIINHK